MTDQLLESILGGDLESQIDNLAHQVLFAASDSYGIDVRAMYCLHTGKRIGQLDWSTFKDALLDESFDLAMPDLEALADAMMTRCVASMRPSPALNKPDRFTIANLATRRPVDALAYLVNRLNGNRQLLTSRNGQTSFAPLLGRIETHQRWTSLAAEGVDLSPWTHWLLELDSKMNLHDLEAPRIAREIRSRRWTIVRKDGESLLDLVTKENCAELLKLFESWVFDKLEIFDARDKQMTREAQWFRGNAHTKTAYFDSYMNNSNVVQRKTAAIEVATQKKTRGRPVSEKTQQKQAQMKIALGVLDAILSGQLADALESQPAPAPAKPKGVLFGNQLNFAKKGA